MGFRGQLRGRPHCCGVMGGVFVYVVFLDAFLCFLFFCLCYSRRMPRRPGMKAEGRKSPECSKTSMALEILKWNRYRDLKQGGLARARPFPYLRTQRSPFSATIDSKLDLQNAVP